jgi:hypothetical protein
MYLQDLDLIGDVAGVDFSPDDRRLFVGVDDGGSGNSIGNSSGSGNGTGSAGISGGLSRHACLLEYECADERAVRLHDAFI